jgi:hypothetical protein
MIHGYLLFLLGGTSAFVFWSIFASGLSGFVICLDMCHDIQFSGCEPSWSKLRSMIWEVTMTLTRAV